MSLLQFRLTFMNAMPRLCSRALAASSHSFLRAKCARLIGAQLYVFSKKRLA